MNYIIKYFIGIFVCFICCVDPPEYSDGLLENIPAVISEPDYFSLSVLGLDYTDKKEWNLEFTTDNDDILLTTIVVKNINISSSDSTFLYLLNEQGDTMFIAGILNNFNFSSYDSLSNIGIPYRVALDANNFTGNLDYQLIIE